MRTATRTRPARFAVVALAALLLVALLSTPVAALAASQFTNTQVSTAPTQGDPSTTYGGQPTRYTFTLVSGADSATMTAVTIVFPKGTSLAKATADVVTLEGLTRKTVATKAQISGETLTLPFDPVIGKGSNTRIQVFEVVSPPGGGDLNVTGTWQGEGGVSGEIPAMGYTQVAVTPWLTAENYLDAQGWVKAWTSVPLLNMFLKPQLLVRSIPLLFVGWLLSIALVAVAYPAAMPIGLALAFMKMSKIGIVRGVSSAYVNVIRGTPLFLQIYLAFFALPLAGVRADPFLLGVIVLALNSSAYMAEIFRAGIQSINKGQFEAASSLGMSYAQAMGYVIIPQTVRRVLPTMTSEFILLFKDTALLSAVGVFELMRFAQGIAANTGNVTPYLEAAAFYLILTIPLINYVGKLEARLALSEGGSGPSPRKKKRGAELLEANDEAVNAAGNLPGA
jgi:His/Glu/Gln/Arg/opine family amino acid ABC transporter permease subunit